MIGDLLCRVGLHRWSTPRGGIKVCTRADCEAATTFGLSGLLRSIRDEQELYRTYHRRGGRDE